jgi:hypothetical protein
MIILFCAKINIIGYQVPGAGYLDDELSPSTSVQGNNMDYGLWIIGSG